ncbi:S-adenosyl-L-methionine-dependent methyltransferase, partial [Caulochytrium protostelioides]
YLRDDVAWTIADRLRDIKRHFPTMLDLGAGYGYTLRHLDASITDHVIVTDTSPSQLARRPPKDGATALPPDDQLGFQVTRRVVDEEALPFAASSLDACISSLALHWVNDLPGTLAQIRHVLKPDAPLVAALAGGDTLYQLRTSLQLAETDRRGGFGPHVSPMASASDVGMLLQQAGFALTTVDVDEVTIAYPSLFELLEDLRGMGESNALFQRKGTLCRDVLIAADAIYREVYGNEDGSLPATFQFIHAIGWKPDPSQVKPKARGSATASFKDLLSKQPQEIMEEAEKIRKELEEQVANDKKSSKP